MSGTIRVVVVDDHKVVRVGLCRVLDAADGIEVVGDAGNAHEALPAVTRTIPDVVIVDVRMPGGDGLQLVREIRSRHPDTACLMFTSFADEQVFYRAVMAGAAGYLLKDADNAEIVDAVRRAADGEQLVPSEVIDELRAREEEVELDAVTLAELTPQERAIVRLIAKGHTNREIAAELHLAEKTVRNYVSNVLAKLGMKNRTEVAVHIASRAGSPAPGSRAPDRRDLVASRTAPMRSHPAVRMTA